MSDQNGSAALQQDNVPSTDKGKGKATESAAQDISMDEDESSSEEEIEEVSYF